MSGQAAGARSSCRSLLASFEPRSGAVVYMNWGEHVTYHMHCADTLPKLGYRWTGEHRLCPRANIYSRTQNSGHKPMAAKQRSRRILLQSLEVFRSVTSECLEKFIKQSEAYLWFRIELYNYKKKYMYKFKLREYCRASYNSLLFSDLIIFFDIWFPFCEFLNWVVGGHGKLMLSFGFENGQAKVVALMPTEVVGCVQGIAWPVYSPLVRGWENRVGHAAWG